jgi:DNA-binding MarR family transcriptional regulator
VNERERPSQLDGKIVAAFERISEAIRTLAWRSSKEHLLNPVQTRILIFLLHHDQGKHTISNLAREFGITKASISDTVSSLEQRNLVQKIHTENDARSFVIQLNDEGRTIAQKSILFTHDLAASIGKLLPDDKHQLFSTLGDIIFDLHKSGVVTVQRMCQTCDYFDPDGKRPACKLLGRSLAIEQLQIDCNEHRLKQ